MRLCTLYSSYEGSQSPYKDIDPAVDPSWWLPDHTWSRQPLTRANAREVLEQLAKEDFDAFINLCDGAPDEDIAGVEVIQHLERLGLPFTGADSHFYAASREEHKHAWLKQGISTPGHRFASELATVEQAASELRFPILVKPHSGYASIGIEQDSRVGNREALLERAGRTLSRFGGLLLEEFIEGREFTVLVSEPRTGEHGPWVHPPVEIHFPEGETFKHFDLKWMNYEAMNTRPVTDEGLVKRLGDIAQRTFSAVNARGYCRCDIRMDDAGQLFMLDCNANPGVFYPPDQPGSADFILSLQPHGHRDFLLHIIDCARRAHGVNTSGS
ncbi:D-alanine--D-alanine ligase [Cystobacter fuscus]